MTLFCMHCYSLNSFPTPQCHILLFGEWVFFPSLFKFSCLQHNATTSHLLHLIFLEPEKYIFFKKKFKSTIKCNHSFGNSLLLFSVFLFIYTLQRPLVSFSFSSFIPTCCASSTHNIPPSSLSFLILGCNVVMPSSSLSPTPPRHHSTLSVIRARWRQRWSDAGREDWVWS